MPRTVELKFDVGEVVWCLPRYGNPHVPNKIEVSSIRLAKDRPEYWGNDGYLYFAEELFPTKAEAEEECSRRNRAASSGLSDGRPDPLAKALPCGEGSVQVFRAGCLQEIPKEHFEKMVKESCGIDKVEYVDLKGNVSSDPIPVPTGMTIHPEPLPKDFAKYTTKVSMEDKYIIESLDLLCWRSHNTAKGKGWWDDCYPVTPYGEDHTGEVFANIHSEISEAWEGLRKGSPADEHCPEFTSPEVELADCLIRIFDYCGAHNLRLGEAVLAKMRYNQSRSYRHGGKKY